jgi:hypothetical protein
MMMTGVKPCQSDELTLDQMFAEPIVRLVMNRDGVDEDSTRRLLRQVAATRDVATDAP